MKPESQQLPAGLYLVATPIGAARDITLRALDILARADVLTAEDTRTIRRLMDIHGITLNERPLIAYHDHNGPRRRPQILAHLAAGRSVAYVSEAGTPLVADPGYTLVRAAIEAGHGVHAAPGASAVLAALTVSGLPSDRFMFAGFPPPAAGARGKFLAGLADVGATLILYESPKRIHKTLADLVQYFGESRKAALCRELTKRFEETMRGTLGELRQTIGERKLKGEIAIVVEGAAKETASEDEMTDALRAALERHSLKDAVAEVSARLGLPRRIVYRKALEMAGTGDENA